MSRHKLISIFRITLLLHLALATYLLEGPFSSANVAFFVGLYLFSDWAQRWIWGNQFFDFRLEARPQHDDWGFVYLGSSLPYHPDEARERNLLMEALSGRSRLRFIGVVIFLIGLTGLALKFVEKMSWTWSVIIFVAIAISLAAVIYVEHFLIPLFLGFALLAFAERLNGLNPIEVTLFVFSASLNLLLYHFSQADRGRVTDLKSLLPILKSTLIMTLAVMGFLSFSDSIVPHSGAEFWKPKAQNWESKVADQIVNAMVKAGGDQSAVAKAKVSQGPPPELSPSSSLANGLSASPFKPNPVSNLGKGNLQNSGTQSGGDSTHEGTARGSESSRDLSKNSMENGSEADAAGKLAGESKNEESNTQNHHEKEETGRSSAEDQSRGDALARTDNQSKTGDDQKADDQKVDGQTNKEAGAKATSGERDTVEELKKWREEQAEKIRETIDKTTKYSKWAIAIAIVAFGVWLLRTVLSTKRDRQVREEPLPAKERKKLLQQYHQIRSRKLSADDEVIETFHLFLSIMAARQRPRPEGLPTSEYTTKLATEFPVLRPQFGVLNETFCNALFGKLDQSPQLPAYRKAYSQIEKLLL